jgi:Cu/Ag efflux protein CusF
MKRNEILGEHKKGTKAVKYNKKPKDHSAEYGKAKEKLAPVKPMEGYNPNSVGAEHRRMLDQSHAADLKARAEGPDATERDQQRYQNYLDRKEQMRNDYNDRMEREGIGHDRTTHRGGKITATSRGIKHEKTDYEDDNIVFKRKDDDEANPSRYKKYAILDPDDSVDEGRWDRRDAYQRDYDNSQSGMGRRDFGYDDAGYSLAPGHDEGDPVYSRAHDRIGHGGPGARREPAADVPHDVYIDGRKWKTFGSASHASNVAKKLQANGKSATVKASSTDEAMGAEVGKITKVDPTTKKATLTKTDGSSMEVDSTALKPTPDGKMSMDTPDTDELKTGTAVVSTENVELTAMLRIAGLR